MKRPYIKLLGLLVIIITTALVYLSIKDSQKYRFDKSAEAMHQDLLKNDYYLNPEKAWEIIGAKDQKYVFVDLRNPREFDNFHIEGAINVPMQRVLDEEYVQSLKNDKTKVLYSNESIKADQIRVLLSQYGYENLMILQGGAKYWKENMISKNVFKSKKEYDDEKLKFDPEKLKKAS